MKKILFLPLIWLAKLVSFTSRIFRLGAGETWPGHLILETFPEILPFLEKQLLKGSVLISGTNGKTTTAALLGEIFKKANLKVIHNKSGANLLNGIASSLILDCNLLGKVKSEIGVFEVDEGNLPLALLSFTPEVVILLNLSRDQLDRYGEIDLILERWLKALEELPKNTILLVNRDEERFKVFFKKGLGFSLKEPKGFLSPLEGDFNQRNTNAAVLAAQVFGIPNQTIKKALANFKPAFGRGEEIFVNDKKVKILLSKNPASFNENLRLLSEKDDICSLLLVLNDNIPDGRDVSWIYDIESAHLKKVCEKARQIFVSGKRAEDLNLRLKYTGIEMSNGKCQMVNNLKTAIFKGLYKISKDGIFYILPTYSAMLEVRKILTGKSIGY